MCQKCLSKPTSCSCLILDQSRKSCFHFENVELTIKIVLEHFQKVATVVITIDFRECYISLHYIFWEQETANFLFFSWSFNRVNKAEMKMCSIFTFYMVTFCLQMFHHHVYNYHLWVIWPKTCGILMGWNPFRLNKIVNIVFKKKGYIYIR